MVLSPKLQMSDFVDILSMIPNVEHLSLCGVHPFGTIDQPEKRRRLDDLNLNYLEKVELHNCSDDILNLFNRLPHGILLELDLDLGSPDISKLDQLLKRQTNIRKLTVHHFSFRKSRSQAVVTVNSFDHLNLESLDWQQHQFNFNIAAILSCQPNLKSLRLNDVVDVNVMNVVTNQLSDLESLTIDVSATPASSIWNIRKLKNLKHLGVQYLHNRDMVLFDAISNFDNSRLSSVDITSYTNISPAQYRALSMSAPKLKLLRCNYDRSTFGAIMENFNFVECLRFHSYVNEVIGPNDNYFDHSCVNPNLIELSLVFEMLNETRFLEKLSADVPNLKRLAIKSRTPITTSQFQLILSGFPRLESLSVIEGASTLTQSDFDYLQVYKNNLKFISLNGLDPKLIGNEKNFSAIRVVFDVVKVDRYGNLTAAADTKTLIREKDYQIQATKIF